MKLKQVRRAQTITPFGVGSILDIEGESFIAVDISYWKGGGEEIHEPRLEKKLGVKSFKMAPAAPETSYVSTSDASRTIPYMRFPRWMFCPSCRNMKRWISRDEELLGDGKYPSCSTCKGNIRLTPMRFVVACPRGHLSDVDWVRWAHSLNTSNKKCENPHLSFLTLAGGSGLEFLVIHCKTCNSRRTLEGIASPDSMRQIGVYCSGRQPWENESTVKCDAIPQVLQRGATNLTFAMVESAIDIPPFSTWEEYSADTLKVTNHEGFNILKSSLTAPWAHNLIEKISEETGVPQEAVKRIALSENGSATEAGESTVNVDQDSIFREEYSAYLAPDVTHDPRDRFIKRIVPQKQYLNSLPNDSFGQAVHMLASHVSTICQVIRLREVRTLTGFSRLAPTVRNSEDEAPGTFSVYNSPVKISTQMVPASLIELDDPWLPAVEVYGEGIFLELDNDAVIEWENRAAVKHRIARLQERYEAGKMGYLPRPEPRLVLLHTLAHLVIRQLSFECGYATASLRERVYASASANGTMMSGVLVYTAAGDSEGTLGGLVREGEAPRLFARLLAALQSAEWCSSDPLCRESEGQGSGAMNLAACHACTLLPETSCTLSNRMLDRAMLLGTPKKPELGFFSDLIKFLMKSLISTSKE